MSKPPAFQFYPRDWLSSATVVAMGPANAGLYIWLIARQGDGTPIPADPEAIRALLPSTYLDAWPGFIAPLPGQASGNVQVGLGDALGWLSLAFPKINGRYRGNRRLGEVLAEREAYTKAAVLGGQATRDKWLKAKAGLGPIPGPNGRPKEGTAPAPASPKDQKPLRSAPTAPPTPPQGVGHIHTEEYLDPTTGRYKQRVTDDRYQPPAETPTETPAAEFDHNGRAHLAPVPPMPDDSPADDDEGSAHEPEPTADGLPEEPW